MIKRLFLSLSLLVFSVACMAESAAPATYEAGVHYDLISPPVRLANSDKIVVSEFFWYGCGHCYNFEPMLQEWKKTLPADVKFTGVPAIWNDKMDMHARTYYAAEALGVLDKIHPAIFQAMHVDRKPLASRDELARLFSANGVPADDFEQAYDSFGVSSQTKQAAALVRSAKITGTPALMVNGKYHISASKAGGQAGMLKVADFLIEQERAARAQ